MVVVYLSNQYMKVVVGSANGNKLTVNAMHYSIDTKGGFVNGNVANREALVESIKELWISNAIPKTQVYLVLNGSQISTRMLEMPVLKEKELFGYVKRELSGVDRISDPVYGYIPMNYPLDETKLQSVFAMAAAREYIQQFVDIFAECGIILSGVENVKGSMVRLVSALPELTGKTCVVQFVDHMNLTSVLLVNGRYRNSNEKRIFAEPGTPSYVVEIARAVGEVLQFAKTQNIDTEITNVYYSGLDAVDCQIYEESVARVNSDLIAEELTGRNVSFQCSLDGMKDFSHFALTIGALIPVAAKANIMEGMRHSPELEAKKAAMKKIIIPGSIAVIVVVIAILIGIVQRVALNNKKSELLAYTQNPAVLADCAEYDELREKTGESSRINGDIDQFLDTMEEYPKVDSKMIAKMEKHAGPFVNFTVTGYQADNGTLSFICQAEDVAAINRFVDGLEESGLVTDIRYEGYTSSGDKWTVKLSCLVAPAKEKEEATE